MKTNRTKAKFLQGLLTGTYSAQVFMGGVGVEKPSIPLISNDVEVTNNFLNWL